LYDRSGMICSSPASFTKIPYHELFSLPLSRLQKHAYYSDPFSGTSKLARCVRPLMQNLET
jgi:hypothetical protein